MRGFNKAIIMGNLARDPEVRYTASKQAVARITVAVNRRWKGSNGEVQEQVDFIPVSVWGIQAEHCEQYLSKGSGVLVEGRISVRSYEKDGQKRFATEVVAQSIQFIGGRRDEGGAAPSRGGPHRDEPATRPPRFGSLRDEKGFTEEDFPLDISDMPEDRGGEEADIPF
ncbi:MAG TPA: single-stranded DNA-binding protein [Synergistaceae bacterium]|nr:single-stranded DNA-binding protein [Synergistaceae bacterium]HQF91353.1 single-stranded DNA-binding protein [Synergistaceae bacterium]HQH78347.1 single-stranded DNA-binding protein [Synergistaceae bacterium]HQK24512.1 single-stranded DNA-binding protein [Synergistaceae bacterium]